MEDIGEPAAVASMRAHRGEVTCADVHAAGGRLVTGGGDRSLRLWRWAAGGWQEAGVAAAAHRYGVTAARWSGAGALVASGGVDGCVRLWEGRALGGRRVLAAPNAAAVRALCWAGAGAGGGRLVAGHDDGAVCVWAVARGVLAVRLVAHEGALHAVAAPAGGSLLLTACTTGVLKVFDFVEVCGSRSPPAAALTWVDGAHDLGALCADASPEGAAAVTGGQDGALRVWRRAAGGRGLMAAGALEGHAAAVTAVRWRGDVVASGSLDRTARLWSPLTLACLHVVHAHARYLTCVALDDHLRYLITGSNDRSVRTWSLGTFTLDDELEVPCVALSHFGVGDLKGIGPVECDEFTEGVVDDASCEDDGEEAAAGAEDAEGEARRVWRAPHAHAGAINGIATHGDLLATASSDGTVKVFRWSSAAGVLVEEVTLEAHHYPAMAVDFGVEGALLLTGGLDARACLWDVQSGLQLRELSVPCGGAGGEGVGGCAGGEAGGGGVRGARLSSHRPPMMMLATDDGLAPLWSLADADPHPSRVYSGHTDAVTCCAWATSGRVAATGAASGDLSVLAPPAPLPLRLYRTAHDLGVQSCDFAPESLALQAGHLVLATGGCDSLLKLWLLDCTHSDVDTEGSTEVVLRSMRPVRTVEAHGGGVTCVRWGREANALLATAGADRWARVWRVARGGGEVTPVCAVPAAGAGGALAVAPLGSRLLAVGTLAGELALWRLASGRGEREDDDDEDDEGAAPRFWSSRGVARWLREYVTRSPGSGTSRADEAELLRRARDENVMGARLLDDDLDELLETLGYGEVLAEKITLEGGGEEEKRNLEITELRARLRVELAWLRRSPPPRHREASAPHELLCPLTHRLMREPASAADGFTYERANILEWMLAAGTEGAVSPVSGRRLRNTRVSPNYAARDLLRQYIDTESESTLHPT